MRKLYFLFIIIIVFNLSGYGQLPYSETFQNNTAPSMVIAGSASLTAATGADPAGQGYLRLTDNGTFSIGYAYCQQSFPSTYGITASFEFFMWKSDALGYNQADGLTFFLFDASTNSFRPGGTGGSLGYANYYTTPGMAKGYMGIAIDGFGNFSNPTDGNKNGGPGRKAGSVVIRGPGNGATTTDYVYQTGVIASDPAYNAGFLGFTQRFPTSTSANYRKLQIILSPGSSLGATTGYTISVKMIKGGSPTTTVTLINNYDYPFAAPANLKFGVAASTGSIYNYQEIRNMNITATTALVPSVLLPDVATVCSGTAIIDVLHNDASMNSGGTMNNASIDLDPSTAGKQSSFTDPGKGVYTVDPVGIVTFTPQAGFTGISSINYSASDIYGASAAAATSITVTVNPVLAPSLTISDPSAVCSPATVNITNPIYKIATSVGASYDYYNTLSDALSNTSNINSTAANINTSGTYYIRASLLGCATVRPVNVQISTPPTTANAGADISSCSSTGALNATLLATNPTIGIGTWTQVSGSSTIPVNFINAATTPVLNMPQGVYTYRWTVTNGACTASSDDVVITVGIPANAGTAKTICNATGATLAGNAPSPGIGLWTRTAGPSLTIGNSALATSSLTGLVPGNTYTMQWKITNGSCVSTSNVIITNVLNTIANAGVDQVLSLNAGTLQGNSPDAGNTGSWLYVSGPTGNTASISQSSNPSSGVTGLNKNGEYIFRWTMTNGSFSNSDDVKITIISVLPVSLVSFKGSLQEEKVNLLWQTAAEKENDLFNIERSVDGVLFKLIGSVAGAGNSTSLSNYSFVDEVSGISTDKVYYRLQQVDKDGRSTISSVVTINLRHALKISCLPNPFVSTVNLKILSPDKGRARINLYSTTGERVKSLTTELSKGQNLITLQDLNKLPAGPVSLTIEINSRVFKQLLIKQ